MQELAWAMETSQGEFSLILARRNYEALQDYIVRKLRQVCAIEFQEIYLNQSVKVKSLYTTILEELGDEQPAAVMVFGLESLSNLEQVLITTNQVREEFRKHCPFPLVLWVNDEVLETLIRFVPDLESWATTTNFVLSSNHLIEALAERESYLFTRILDAGGDQFLPNTAIFGSSYCRELDSALRDLQTRGDVLEITQEASLPFVLGREAYINGQIDQALEYYQQSLAFWQQESRSWETQQQETQQQSSFPSRLGQATPISPYLRTLSKEPSTPSSPQPLTPSPRERQALLLFHIGLCYLNLAELNRSQSRHHWITARGYFQKCIDTFEQAKRPDLIAKFITKLGETLQRLEAWKDLQGLAQRSLVLHRTYGNPLQLSQDYGFIAAVALQDCRWMGAQQAARKALELLTRLTNTSGQYQMSYLLLLAQAKRHLGLSEEAITILERAKETGPMDSPQLYIRILEKLRTLYFRQKQYLEAFRVKQERFSVEQQYGFRAFIGPGRLKPHLRQSSTLLLEQETPAEEITASVRQNDVERLVERIGSTQHKLTVIYGQSGVGKSSVLEAGLVPTLKTKVIGTRDVVPILVRVYTDWVREVWKSLASSPLKVDQFNLESSSVLNVDQLNGEGSSQLKVDRLKVVREAWPKGQGSQQYSNLQPATQTNLQPATQTNLQPATLLEQLRQNEHRNLLTVLIFDQFEEFFFIWENHTERKRFFDFFRECLQIPFVKVILSLRENDLYFLLQGIRHQNFDSINNNILNKNILYYLGNFSLEDAKSIIQRLTERSQVYLEEALVNTLVQELGSSEGEVRPIELQIVGAQLQTEGITTLAHYRRKGPKEKLVQRYLQEVIADCGSENEKAAELILYLLTEENNTRPPKTRQDLEKDLNALAVDLAIEKIDQLDLVLNILVESGLVVLLRESPLNRYQLVHDYLVSVIRQQQDSELLAKLKKAQEQHRLSQAQLQKSKIALTGSIALVGMLAISTLSAAIFWAQARNNEIRALIKSSEALYGSNSHALDPLKDALEAGKKLKWSVGVSSDTKDIAMSSLQQAFYGVRERNRLEGHNDTVNNVSFSPDGELIATASSDNVKIWSKEGKELYTLAGKHKHKDEIRSVTFSPDGKLIATASKDKTVKVWQRNGKYIQTLTGHTGWVWSVRFSPDLKSLAASSEDGRVIIWSLEGKKPQIFKAHDKAVLSISFSPDSKVLATGSFDNTVKLWRRDRNGLYKRKPLTIQAHEDAVFSVSFSPKGKLIATGSKDKTVKLWKMDGTRYQTLGNDDHESHQSTVTSITFSPDGQTLASASADNTVKLWNRNGKLLETLTGHESTVWSVNFSPDSQTLASASADNTVKLWSRYGNELPIPTGEENTVFSVSYSPDGQTIATASKNNTIQLWSLNGQLQRTLTGHTDWVWGVSFSPDGKTIASASADKTAKLWNKNGKLLHTLSGHEKVVRSITFSPDGKIIATASRDNTVKLWNQNGILIRTLTGHTNWVNSVTFSPDGETLATASAATASSDPTVKLWNVSDGKELKSFDGHTDWVFSVRFSPDGKTLASASRDKTVKLWNVSDGEELTSLDGHQNTVWSVVFSPDGETIATASADQTVKVWNRKGKQLQTFYGHDDGVVSLSFSPDGQTIASSDSSARVIIWNLDNIRHPDQLQSLACDWLQDYLKHNTNVNKGERRWCR
ncbi:WD-40 repeat-containing protein [Moorena producens 3L]|uniref:WD-40 repeat-containing protein n=3 Tax=Coleofasciculaceae TaxID=1892251 RepID=F4XXP7_9CYAN|nr:WD-40 repeat-containing protein [Moorena producens 3L]